MAIVPNHDLTAKTADQSDSIAHLREMAADFATFAICLPGDFTIGEATAMWRAVRVALWLMIAEHEERAVAA